MPKGEGVKLIASNRKARHRYQILETVEAGLSLLGTEVKALREGKASIGEAFVRPVDGELFLVGMNIPTYSSAGYSQHEPTRPRKLLLRSKQIHSLTGQILQKGHSMVPLRLYFKRGYAKAELALVRGKKMRDKREDLKRRQEERDAARHMGRRR